MPVFAVGMFVSTRKNWINDKIPYSSLFLFAAIGLLLLEKSGFSFHVHQAYIYIALTLGMPSLIMVNISFLKILPDIFKTCITFFGICSLELYLVHEFIFWSLKINFVDVNPWLLLPSSILLSCLAAYICKFTIKKILPWKNTPTTRHVSLQQPPGCNALCYSSLSCSFTILCNNQKAKTIWYCTCNAIFGYFVITTILSILSIRFSTDFSQNPKLYY